MKFTVLVLPLFLAACSNEASHLPSPLELPGTAIGSVFENMSYGARRKRVKNYVSNNYAEVREQAKTGQGPQLEQAMNIAGIPAIRRATARAELMDGYERYFTSPESNAASVEQVVVVLMVHS